MGLKKMLGMETERELAKLEQDALHAAHELELVRQKQLSIAVRIERLRKEGSLYKRK